MEVNVALIRRPGSELCKNNMAFQQLTLIQYPDAILSQKCLSIKSCATFRGNQFTLFSKIVFEMSISVWCCGFHPVVPSKDVTVVSEDRWTEICSVFRLQTNDPPLSANSFCGDKQKLTAF
jgi:hypothetical protein